MFFETRCMSWCLSAFSRGRHPSYKLSIACAKQGSDLHKCCLIGTCTPFEWLFSRWRWKCCLSPWFLLSWLLYLDSRFDFCCHCYYGTGCDVLFLRNLLVNEEKSKPVDDLCWLEWVLWCCCLGGHKCNWSVKKLFQLSQIFCFGGCTPSRVRPKKGHLNKKCMLPCWKQNVDGITKSYFSHTLYTCTLLVCDSCVVSCLDVTILSK